MDQQTDPDVDRFVNVRLTALASTEAWEPNAAGRLADLRRRQAQTRARRRRAAGAVVAAGMVMVALPGTRAFGAKCVGACVGVASRATQFWRASEPAASAVPTVGAAVGDLAPDVVGVDRRGAPVQLAALRGHVVVVNFWATWCGPCQAEIPLLNKMQADLGPSGLDVIGVSLDEDGWPAVASFAANQPLGYTVAMGNDDVSAAFGGVDALPSTFVIGRDGRIVIKMMGALGPEHVQKIAELLAR